MGSRESSSPEDSCPGQTLKEMVRPGGPGGLEKEAFQLLEGTRLLEQEIRSSCHKRRTTLEVDIPPPSSTHSNTRLFLQRGQIARWLMLREACKLLAARRKCRSFLQKQVSKPSSTA